MDSMGLQPPSFALLSYLGMPLSSSRAFKIFSKQLSILIFKKKGVYPRKATVLDLQAWGIFEGTLSKLPWCKSMGQTPRLS